MPQPRTYPAKRILGIDFFDGSPTEVVHYLTTNGGLLVAPAAPSLVALQTDREYRRAMADADVAIADSGWMVIFWKLLRREKLSRISGLAFFKALLASPEARISGNFFWILPREKAKAKTLRFARESGYPLTAADCYVAPHYGASAEDPALAMLIDTRRPKHIIIGIGGGMQDKIGSYLKHRLLYRPGIYCIGAAPGFVTGDQVLIPAWADRFFLGWVFRIVSQPRFYLLRYWRSRRVLFLILKYGREMPPLLAA